MILKRKTNTYLIVVGILAISLISLGYFVITDSIHNSKPLEYYAYGDSITAALDGDLNETGNDVFIIQMVNKSLPKKTATHNLDGDGKDSTWGTNALGEHYDNRSRIFVYMFTNDYTDLSMNQTIDNYISIYNYIYQNGTYPVPLIPILTQRNTDKYLIDYQKERIIALEAALDKHDIYYIKMYDALDSIPYNGEVDDFNTTYQPDGIHPNKTGHQIMAQYLWNNLKTRYIGDIFLDPTFLKQMNNSNNQYFKR